MKKVFADAIYTTHTNVEAAIALGAEPYFDFRKNSNPTRPGAYRDLHEKFTGNEWKYQREYNKRSNVESCFRMVKARFGERVRSRTQVAIENEVLCKFLCHNICCVIQCRKALGIQPVWADLLGSALTGRRINKNSRAKSDCRSMSAFPECEAPPPTSEYELASVGTAPSSPPLAYTFDLGA